MSTQNKQESNVEAEQQFSSIVFFHSESVDQWKEEGFRQFPFDFVPVGTFQSDDLELIHTLLTSEDRIPGLLDELHELFGRTIEVGDIVVKSDNSLWMKAPNDRWLPVRIGERLNYPKSKHELS